MPLKYIVCHHRNIRPNTNTFGFYLTGHYGNDTIVLLLLNT